MAVKYNHMQDRVDQKKISMYWEWARQHKTVNILNGFEQTNLERIIELFKHKDNNYPWCQWREDESCNNCLTSVSIVVPEHVYAHEEYPKVELEDVVPLVHRERKLLKGFDGLLYDLIKSTRHAT